MKPLLEFLVWELADCGSDRINVIDRKMSHHYRHFCTPGVPQPITGSGRYLEFVLDMKKTQPLFFGGRGNKIKVRVTAFRGNQWKPASVTPSKNDLPLIGKKTPTKKEWELDFTQQDITTICVGGTFVFCIILGG